MESSKMTLCMVSSETRDSERLGRGVMKYQNGAVYDGEWKDGVPHGKLRGLRD